MIGCGNIGSFIAEYLDKNKKFNLVSIFDVDVNKAECLVNTLNNKPVIVNNIPSLLKDIDLVVEAASQKVLRDYSVEILRAGKDFMLMSVGALADSNLFNNMKKEAKKNKCKIYIPSGAICGVDGIKAAGVGVVDTVTLKTTKPPKAFTNIKYLEDKGINVNNITTSTIVYEGPAGEAVKLFPKNINVSTTLSLLGLGFEKTTVKIIVDPNIENNIHEVCLKGECGEINIKLVNKPSPTNPKSSHITSLSAVRTLEDMVDVIKIGT